MTGQPASSPDYSILSAFQPVVARPRSSILYQLSLLLVTITMLLLPLIYLALVGAAAQVLLRRAGRATSIVLAAVLASALFGAYHYAHSTPFNTLQMVLLLAVVGLFTSAFFFVSRDIAGTIVFLASDAAAYTTGAVIPVDGGLGMGAW